MMQISDRVSDQHTFCLENVLVPRALLGDTCLDESAGGVPLDLLVKRGVLAEVRRHQAEPGVRDPSAVTRVDCQGRLLTPTLVDCHVHLDKCHIASRCPSPEGDLHAAIEATEADKPNWTEYDVRCRAERALAAAYHAGVGVMRTHVDLRSPHESDRITPVDTLWLVAKLRDEWAGRIELQVATLTPADRFATEPDAAALADRAAEYGFALGAFHYRHPNAEVAIRNLLAAAAQRDLDVDFHVDEGLDADATGLLEIAATVEEQGYDRRVLCGHACSLSVMNSVEAGAVIEAVAAAGIGLVTLPLTNAYLQDRGEAQTPRRRGLTLVHELRTAGVSVAVATDNVCDPFYPYGEFDPVSTLRFAVPYGHLADPVGEWLPAISSAAGQLIGATASRPLAPGGPADFVLFEARDATELFSSAGSPRTVFRSGQPLEREI